MKTIALAILATLYCGISFSQQDSVFISVFVSPVEELIIEEQDSLALASEALLLNGLDEEFDYVFFVSGFDTLLVNSFDISFVCDDGETVEESYTMSQIDSDPTLERMEDSVFLPLGQHEFHYSYSYSVTLRDADDAILLTQEEEFEEEN